VSPGEIDQSMRDYTVNLIASIRVSDEGQEGLSSFLEKRKANWVAKK
jgi:methylglutaconyl-CoA hydratase